MIFHPTSVLKKLRDLADRYHVLLIFDEVFTGSAGRARCLHVSWPE